MKAVVSLEMGIMKIEITTDVAQKLGNYVYAYVDPRNGEVFYIGKGAGSRATTHLNDRAETEKVKRIQRIRDAGQEPRIDIVAQRLRDDTEASRVEAALIELVGVHRLTNEIRGLGTNEFPRRPLADIVMECSPRQVDIDIPCLLIRINKLFEYGMSDEALYESTRGIWVVGHRRDRARFAMAVYAGIVREVYEIVSWHRAGSTPYNTRDVQELAQLSDRRWEFVGHVAQPLVREKYIGGSVEHLFRQGQQSPVVGVGL